MTYGCLCIFDHSVCVLFGFLCLCLVHRFAENAVVVVCVSSVVWVALVANLVDGDSLSLFFNDHVDNIQGNYCRCKDNIQGYYCCYKDKVR